MEGGKDVSKDKVAHVGKDGSEQRQGKKKKKKKNKRKQPPPQAPEAKKLRVDEQPEEGEEEAKETEPVGGFAETDPADHCETPIEAYEDVAVLLDALCAQLKRTRATLRVYDPYYCAGGVVERLAQLGFGQVVNEPRDCYS